MEGGVPSVGATNPLQDPEEPNGPSETNDSINEPIDKEESDLLRFIEIDDDVETGGQLVAATSPEISDEIRSSWEANSDPLMPPDNNNTSGGDFNYSFYNSDDSNDDDDDDDNDDDSPLSSQMLSEERQNSADKLSNSVRWNFERILVLVDLQLLNSISTDVSLSNNPNSASQIAIPVNKYGFPFGFGRTEQEQSGPYLYVACAYKNVRRLSSSMRTSSNNSGSERGRVTVERCDTGEWATIRSDWETYVLEDTVAIMAALFAAKIRSKDKRNVDFAVQQIQTVTAMGGAPQQQQQPEEEERESFWYNRLLDYCSNVVIPGLKRALVATKVLMTKLMQGGKPFSCKVRITGINLMVGCSITFLFLQVFQLGWINPKHDQDLNWLGLVVWCILVLELIFEFLIRPADYKELMQSEKAYRPSSARHITRTYLIGETLALLLYFPEIYCLREDYDNICLHGPLGRLTMAKASATAILGPTMRDTILGRLVLGSIALRFFGVVRHWQHMLIQQTFRPTPRVGLEKFVIPFDPATRLAKQRKRRLESKKQNDDDSDDDDDTADESVGIDVDDTDIDFSNSKENRRLKSAANIGTAIIVTNCKRALMLMVLSVLVVPLFFTICYQNLAAINLTKLLAAENLVSTTGYQDCEYLEKAIDSWLNMAIVDQLQFAERHAIGETPYVLWAQVLPVRCPFQNRTGVITSCTGNQSRFQNHSEYDLTCDIWDNSNPPDIYINRKTDDIREYFAQELDLRGDGIIVHQLPTNPNTFQYDAFDPFTVTVVFNQNPTIEKTFRYEFWLLFDVFFIGLFFLIILQNQVYDLALNPIRRMLSIVIRYAENPLSSDVAKTKATRDNLDGSDDIGDIETEQLLSAITKISDLLRKCWGVAGAGIISSNLGREKDGQVAVFHPTVPGKQVYALFGFVTICGYSQLLKALEGDVMLLINGIASVVHDEVYRWALGEHGECNKNLGPAFLMVWRIGDFNEVQQKNKAAIEKLFRDKVYKTTTKNHPNLRRRNVKSSKNTYSNAGTVRSVSTASNTSQEIQLESLPGIQGFADRALLGMLKSFAGLHRDRHLQEWKNHPRLKTGGSYSWYTVDVIYGMDAGWAVEGAVGSEYKIDATYLSPHVNMASRMMSASKQYGATILLSKAVEKILSKPCRTKLRHLDTVYVKGSAIKQAIYTYDARYAGVDFFLLERTPEQADHESESYTPAIWDQDQDLVAMRRHVTDEFLETYHQGVKHYLEGNWREAHGLLDRADDIMIQTVLEEGYIEIADDELLEKLEARIVDKTDQGEDVVKLRNEFGDGACRTLMTYMERSNFEAPKDWKGVRQLFSK